MAVSNTTTKVKYNGNGTTRVFSVPFPVLSAEHLKIVVTDSTGVETEITSNYTVNQACNALTYPTQESGLSPLADGYALTIARNTPLTQEIDLHNGATLAAEVLENGYDKITYILQELKEQVDRAVKYALSKSISSGDFTSAEEFLNEMLNAVDTATTAATAAANSNTEAGSRAAYALDYKNAAGESAASAAANATTATNAKLAAAASEANALSYKTAAQNALNAFIPKQIGEVYYSQSNLQSDNLGALPAWTGQTITYSLSEQGPVYKGLYNFVKAHSELCTSNTTYTATIAATGSCPFYVLNETNCTIKLPTLASYIRSVGSGSVGAGTDKVRTLQGEISENIVWRDYTQSGMLKQASSFTEYIGEDRADAKVGKLTLDSSEMEHFNGTETQPAHVSYYPWLVVQTTTDTLVSIHGNVLTVKEYTEEEWNALETKPSNELSLIGYTDQEEEQE